MGRRLEIATDGSAETTRTLPELQPAQRALARLERALQTDRCPRSLSPLYLHGPSGCGKSHLLGQLGERLGKRPGEEMTTITTSGRELGRLLNLADALPPLESARLLVIEEVTTLPAAASDGLASLLDRRSSRRGPVIVTAAVGPALITRHAARLRSRLAGGLVLHIPALGPESRRRFLQQQCTQRGLRLENTALEWLVSEIPGSFRQLLGCMVRLASAKTSETPLTLDQVRGALSEAVTTGKEPLTSERIAREVGRFYRIQPARMRGKSRQRAAMIPRQVAMYLMRVVLQLSLETIGDYFGGRDHTTVLHACRKVEQTLEVDPELAGAVQTLRANLAF